MNGLSLSLLGPFQIMVGGRTDVAFRTRKVQALLIYLAVEPAAHQRELLLNLLWPGLPDKSARSNLRQILYHLRQLIPEAEQSNTPFILANRRDIQLNPDNALAIDTRRMVSLLAEVSDHSHMDIYLCRECHQNLRSALDLYRGDFLADFYLDDSNEFEEWALARREYFRRRALDALEILTTVAIRHNDYAAGQSLAERQLSIDNLRESAYRQLMEALAHNGQREGALAVYNTCRRVLAEELGMAPSTRTTDYYEKILAGDLQFDQFPVQGVRGYELKEEIGSGAYGAIHRAIQPAIQREVAVKVIHRKHAADPEFIRRFESEAQTVARLEHPYIVPLYDYWRDPEGAYLVMRFMRGGSLLDQLRDDPWSLERIAAMLDQLSSALAVAHNQGIIHRDIKPGNILLDEAGNCFLADFGIAKEIGREEQITAEGSVIGTLDYISPEQIVGESVSPQTDIYSLGAVLYETLTGEKPFSDSSLAQLLYSHLNEPVPLVSASRPDISPEVDAVLQKATAKKPGDRFESVRAFCSAFRRSLGNTEADIESTQRETRPAITEIYNPYKGLHAFQETDAEDFFGREALVQQLVDRLATADGGAAGRFLAIVGPSGSGKSSVVKAGLIPALRENGLPGAHKWFITEMVPGSNPFAELESALWRVAVDAPPNLVDPMRRDTRGILRTLKRILPVEDAGPQGRPQLLLIIDQFEELFTLVADEEERHFFLDSLMTALEAPRSPLRVAVTLRADFYDRPLQYQEWGPLIKRRTEVILPLNRAELTWAVREPARRMGVALEEDLAAAIVGDVANQPGALPLVQYAMTTLFEQRQNGVITRRAYRELGGVKGALGRRAEQLFSELPEHEQELARQLFLRLITLGEGVEDTRRRVQTGELERLDSAGGEGETALSTVLERFGAARFLTFDHDPLTRLPTVEVAHEALLREWPRLQEWLKASREDIRRQRMLAQLADQWTAAGEEDSYLLRGSRLVEFESWVESTTVALTAEENEFVYRSIAAKDRRQAEEAARRQRELETARQLADEQSRRAEEQTQAAQSLRQRAIFLTGALFLAAVLAGVAVLFARSANESANFAASEERKAEVEREIALTAQAAAEVNAALASTREAEALIAQGIAQEEADFRATAEADAIENQLFAEQQQELTAAQLRLTTSRELALAANANVETNPERSLLLALTALDNAYTKEAEGVLRVALQENRILFTLSHRGETFTSIAYHPDGLYLAGIDKQGITMWNPANGERTEDIHLADIDFRPDSQIKISPNGDFAAITAGHKIFILDTATWETIHSLEMDNQDDSIDSIDFNPDSSYLASGSVESKLILWDLTTGTASFTAQASDGGYADDVRFSHDGQRIATSGDDLTVRVWDAETGAELARMEHEGLWINNTVFNADATRLFAAPAANLNGIQISVWDLDKTDPGETPRLVSEWVNIHDSLLSGMELSPDGQQLLTYSQDQTIKLWDATSDDPVEQLTITGMTGFINEVVFNPDGSTVASVSDGEVQIWDISLAGQGEILNIYDSSLPVAFSPDGALLYSIVNTRRRVRDNTIKIWNTATGALVDTLDTAVPDVKSVAVSDDGRFLAVGGQDNTLTLWDLITRQELFSVTDAHGPGIIGFVHSGISSIEFSPDSTMMATSGADGYVKLWDLNTAATIYAWRADPRNNMWEGYEQYANGATKVTFSPDGQFLAASTDQNQDEAGNFEGGLIKIFDLTTGNERLSIEDVPGRIWGLDFSSDGGFIASASGSGGAIIWDLATGREVNRPGESNNAGVWRVYFTPNGRYLLLEMDNLVVFDLETEEILQEVPHAVGAYVISPDGNHLAASGPAGRIHVFTLDFAELTEIAQSRVTRGLTEAECRDYLHLDGCPQE